MCKLASCVIPRSIIIAASFCASASCVPLVHAQSYPARPVRILVGIPPGGGVDVLARAVAYKLSERWGQSVIVDNRTGAGGAIAMELVAQASADGYTLLAGSTGTIATASVLKKVAFDTRRAYAPVIEMNSQPYLLVVGPSLKVNSVKELIAIAKSRPGALNYASTGVGSGSHLGMELFKYMAGVDIVHVPYKGLVAAMIDVTGGQIQLALGAALTLSPFVKNGRIKALATGGSRRSQAYPDLPTVADSGLPGFERSNSYAVFAPAATAPAIVQALNREISRILTLPDVQEKFAADGAEPAMPNTPAQFKDAYSKEVAKWEKFFKATGIKI